MSKRFSLLLMVAILFAIVFAQLLLAPEAITAGRPIAYRLGHQLGSDMLFVAVAAGLLRLVISGLDMFTSKEQ